MTIAAITGSCTSLATVPNDIRDEHRLLTYSSAAHLRRAPGAQILTMQIRTVHGDPSRGLQTVAADRYAARSISA